MADFEPDYWKEKPLDTLSREEWEALCDGCAKCCLYRLEDEDTQQIYFTNVTTGETTHVGPDTIGNGEQFWLDSQSGIIERSFIGSMLSMPGYTYRGAGTLDNLTFFAGSNQYQVKKIKAEWLDQLPTGFDGIVLANEVLDALDKG